MSRTSSSAERADVYTRITAEIVAAIEAGTGEWRMPWHHDGTAITRPQNISSGKRYRGVNVLALWIVAEARGYADGLWGTYRQWLSVDAQVRKGERGTTVVLWKQAGTDDDAEDADNDIRRRFFARSPCSMLPRSMDMNWSQPPSCRRLVVSPTSRRSSMH